MIAEEGGHHMAGVYKGTEELHWEERRLWKCAGWKSSMGFVPGFW